MSNEKPRIATACLGGCSGCHMSFLDIDENLVDLIEDVDIDASHVLVDSKKFSDVDVGIVEGTVTTNKDVEVVKDLRAKCDELIAWGDCACLRGIMTMRNFYDRDEILKECYGDKTDHNSEIPAPGSVPELLEEAKPVDDYVDVDLFVPGCPPRAEVMEFTLREVLEGNEPVLTKEDLEYD
ncbi:MAG: NADH:ubiquinone oxidoreductase [Candidatus Hadarchaeia archaeon]